MESFIFQCKLFDLKKILEKKGARFLFQTLKVYMVAQKDLLIFAKKNK